MSVTYKQALQVKYCAWLLAAVAIFFGADEVAKYEHLDDMAGLAGSEALVFKTMAAAYYFSAGAIYAGAAQGSEMSMRKVLQYSMMQSMCALVCYARAYGQVADVKVFTQAAITAVDFLFTTLVLYVFNKKTSGRSSPVQGRMKFLTRCLYVIYGLRALVVFFPEEYLKLYFSASPSATTTWAFARIATVEVLQLGALIAAAQTDEKSTKKLLQYSLTMPMIELYYTTGLFAPFTLSQPQGLLTLYASMKISGVLIVLTVIACYPCALRSWIIRDSWMFYAWAALYHFLYPETTGAVFGYANFSASTSYQVAFLLAFVAILNMAAKRMDVGFTQLQQEKYTIFVDVLLPLMYLVNGTDFGMVLVGKSVQYGLLKGYDLYCESKDMETIFDKEWFATASAPSPMKTPSSPKSPKSGMKKAK